MSGKSENIGDLMAWFERAGQEALYRMELLKASDPAEFDRVIASNGAIFELRTKRPTIKTPENGMLQAVCPHCQARGNSGLFGSIVSGLWACPSCLRHGTATDLEACPTARPPLAPGGDLLRQPWFFRGTTAAAKDREAGILSPVDLLERLKDDTRD